MDGVECIEPPSNLQNVRGVLYPCYKEFRRENIERAMDYKPRDDDIIIASYPKTGTTWLEYIVLQILSKGEMFPSFDDLTLKVVPFIEMTGPDALDNLKEPRIYKQHMPYNQVKRNPKAKCLYIYRNPEDVLVSYYYFLQSFDEDVPIDFNDFTDTFIKGQIGFGSYFEHVLSYCTYKEKSNMLLLSYEKLHADIGGEILRIARFLGEDLYQKLKDDKTLLNRIIENTSFENMKSNLFMTNPDTVNEDGSAVNGGKKCVQLFRKGIVGDGKRKLTEMQRERIKELAEKTLKNTSILNEYRNNLSNSEN